MKKIWITGSSGSGKTTLANRVAESLDLPVYHRDQIIWQENWVERSEEDQIHRIKKISEQDGWVFDGNRLGASKVDGRFHTCDVLIHLEANRFICLLRVVRRYFKHRHDHRKDLAEGCKEALDWILIKYVLFQYPSRKKNRESFFNELKASRKDVKILCHKKDINKWLEDNNI